MLETKKKMVYKAFGLRITSDIPLPELPHLNQHVDSIDIEIKLDDLPNWGLNLKDHPYKHVVKDNIVMFYIPDNGSFAIQDGRRIMVSPVYGSDEGLLRIYILGSCMGAILMQRGTYPLHGSAIAIHGKAYAFVGDSGAGKSTLASAFLSQGYQLLSDDVISITLSQGDRTPYVTPSYPQQKLWQESLDHFGMKSSDFQSIFGRETKYSVPVFSKYCSESLPLAGVFELVKTEVEEIEIRKIDKLQQLQTLFNHTYRQFLIPRLGLTEWHFNISAAIVNQISMFQLRRPTSGFTAPQIVSQLLDSLHMEE